MAVVEVIEARARYGATEVLKGISLRLESSQFVAVLGPSGCGKTTLLRAIAGFADYDGSVRIDGEPYDDVPPHRRNIGLVFQDYALFPHKTVAQNIGFGPRLRRRPSAEIEHKTGELIGLLKLDGLGHRYPSELSGGQRQRVALARALAIEPKLLLLDEPLSALDKKLREDMQVELRQLQRRVGITTLFVTHDQEEALALADKVVVMSEGSIHQIGTPSEIYERPKDRFVATFIGRSNIFRAMEARVADGRLMCRIMDDTIISAGPNGHVGSAEVFVSVRPERLQIAANDGSVPGTNRLTGTVEHVVYLGARQQIRIALANGSSLDIDSGSRERFELGQHIEVAWAPEDTVVLHG